MSCIVQKRRRIEEKRSHDESPYVLRMAVQEPTREEDRQEEQEPEDDEHVAILWAVVAVESEGVPNAPHFRCMSQRREAQVPPDKEVHCKAAQQQGVAHPRVAGIERKQHQAEEV